MKVSTLRAKSFVVLIALSLLTSCTQLPDLKPFADATTRMAGAMRQGYAQTEGLLIRAELDSPRINELRARWDSTKKAINAIVAYSDALAALADAGNKGEESAGALISSLEGVQTAVGALLPGLPNVPATVTTVFRKINGVVAKLRARKALKEAVNDADEALNATATILSLNFQELARLNRAAGQEILNKLEFDHNTLRDYHDGLAAEKNQITPVLTKMLDYQNKDKESTRPTILRDLRNADPAFASDLDAATQALGGGATPAQTEALTLAHLRRRQKHWDERVSYLQGELDRIAPEYDAYQAKKAEIKEVIKNAGPAFSGTVIETWASTHSGLKSALAKKQRVTISELTSVVNELIEIAQTVGKEKANGKD